MVSRSTGGGGSDATRNVVVGKKAGAINNGQLNGCRYDPEQSSFRMNVEPTEPKKNQFTSRVGSAGSSPAKQNGTEAQKGQIAKNERNERQARGERQARN